MDRLEQFEDQAAQSFVLRAHCHGATDEMRITLGDMQKLTPKALTALLESEGRAFAPALPCPS
ncbi:hypothetical protein PWG14_26330 [Chromobacterium amazonense]|uniref:hypothetical protein n=1 Tax=Chromobacterium amazonense TaxID=1382803 RepID=UPI00237E1019|nr:hypothetical protein [Chromobacterium amazonense]MDE1715986.1 hypothetical protein [Chromobacterium amazonense]